MKEIKTERISYDVKWEAIDGLLFNSEQECQKYEETARMVLWAKFLTLVIAESNEYDLFRTGSEDDVVYAVKMNIPSDRDTLMQLFLMDNSWVMKEAHSKWKDRAFSLIDKSYKDNDLLFVGVNTDNQIYIIDTKQSLFERLENLDKGGNKDA